MTTMEIALLVVGVIIFVISFLLPDVPMPKTQKDIDAEKEEVKRLVEQEVDVMKLKVNEATNDSVEYAVDKAERSLEKVSNEKIMAVGEYAGTILEEINKNHQEVMFLYDMLRDKQADLTNTVRRADAAAKEIEAMSHSAQNASETLLRGMSVASVSQKGLTAEQKSVFDDIEIPDAEPVVFKKDKASESVKPVNAASAVTPAGAPNTVKTAESDEHPKAMSAKGKALTQSKIEAQLLGVTPSDPDPISKVINADAPEPIKEKVVYDILSGGAYREGNIVNVDAPAKGSITAADVEALSSAGENNNHKILALARQGFDTVAIAKSLGLGVGEVKLVIDLFQN